MMPRRQMRVGDRRAFLVRAGLLALAPLVAPARTLAQETSTPGAVFQPAPPADAPAAPTAGSRRTVEVSPEEVVRGDPSKPNVTLAINVGAGSEPGLSMLDTLRDR